eukprot:UN08601
MYFNHSLFSSLSNPSPAAIAVTNVKNVNIQSRINDFNLGSVTSVSKDSFQEILVQYGNHKEPPGYLAHKSINAIQRSEFDVF